MGAEESIDSTIRRALMDALYHPSGRGVLQVKYVDPAAVTLGPDEEPDPKNCREAGPGKGLCDWCAAGHWDACRFRVAWLRKHFPRNALANASLSDALYADYRKGPGA